MPWCWRRYLFKDRHDDLRRLAVPVTDASMQRFGELAAKHSIMVCMPYPERQDLPGDEGVAYFNSVALFGVDGKLLTNCALVAACASGRGMHRSGGALTGSRCAVVCCRQTARHTCGTPRSWYSRLGTTSSCASCLCQCWVSSTLLGCAGLLVRHAGLGDSIMLLFFPCRASSVGILVCYDIEFPEVRGAPHALHAVVLYHGYAHRSHAQRACFPACHYSLRERWR